MPIHRGPRLDDMISRLARQPIPIQANIYKTWPNLATSVAVVGAVGGGAWVEFISAANAPTVPFTVTIFCADIYTRGAGEIGVGGVGSEVIVASAPLLDSGGGFTQPHPFPIIPGGSRVAVRMNGQALTGYLRLVSAILPTPVDTTMVLRRMAKLATWYPGTSKATTSNTGNPVAVNPAWTYGSYAQIISATDEPSPLILMSHTCSTYLAGNGQIALGYGGVGAETVFAELPTPQAAKPLYYDLPVPILVPGGTRLAAKYANEGGSLKEADFNTFGCIKGATYL